MQTKPEELTGVIFEKSSSGIYAQFRERIGDRAFVDIPRTLLVGRDLSRGAHLLGVLQKLGSEVFFAPPEHTKQATVRDGAYSLILVDSNVSHEQRNQIAHSVNGTAASVYYAYPVEHDCWWVPVLRFGEYCYGDPAFRMKEFSVELKRILRVTEET